MYIPNVLSWCMSLIGSHCEKNIQHSKQFLLLLHGIWQSTMLFYKTRVNPCMSKECPIDTFGIHAKHKPTAWYEQDLKAATPGPHGSTETLITIGFYNDRCFVGLGVAVLIKTLNFGHFSAMWNWPRCNCMKLSNTGLLLLSIRANEMLTLSIYYVVIWYYYVCV